MILVVDEKDMTSREKICAGYCILVKFQACFPYSPELNDKPSNHLVKKRFYLKCCLKFDTWYCTDYFFQTFHFMRHVSAEDYGWQYHRKGSRDTEIGCAHPRRIQPSFCVLGQRGYDKRTADRMSCHCQYIVLTSLKFFKVEKSLEMIERRLVKSRIKDDCIVDYLRIHDTIDPAVIEEYRKIGIKCISCFVDGYDLYVYSEAEVDGEEAAKNIKPINKGIIIKHTERKEKIA